MLYAALFLGALVAGVQAQDEDEIDLRADGLCVAESNGVDYDFCGRVDPFNLYWNFAEGEEGVEIEEGRLSLIFEVLDNGYHSMGFGFGDAAGTFMINATVLFGCQDFEGFESTDVFDFQIPSRTGADIVEAITLDETATHESVTQTREDGICAIRFERDAQSDLVDATQYVDEDGTYLVFAMGDNEAIAIHDVRTVMLVSLTDGLTELDDVVSLLDLVEEEEEVDEDDDEEMADDGGASMLSLSKAAATIVAAAAYALF